MGNYEFLIYHFTKPLKASRLIKKKLSKISKIQNYLCNFNKSLCHNY